jgi:hypothetical protein
MYRPHEVIATPCFSGLIAQAYLLSITRLMTRVGDHIELFPVAYFAAEYGWFPKADLHTIRPHYLEWLLSPSCGNA